MSFNPVGMHANNVPRAPIRVEHCGTRGTFSNVRLAASVDGLMFVLLIKEIKMIISECECCNEKRELEELVVESEMCGSCEEYNLGFVCKSCKENKGIVDELLKEYL